MKKAFLFLSAILIAVAFTGCKPDNYLYGLKWYEVEIFDGAQHHIYDFYSKDSCEIRYFGRALGLLSKEHQPYRIKNKTTFYIGPSNSELYEYEYNPNNNCIKSVKYNKTFYPEPRVVK